MDQGQTYVTIGEYNKIRESRKYCVFQCEEPCQICYGDSKVMDLVAIVPPTGKPYQADFICTLCAKKIALHSLYRSELTDAEEKEDFLAFCRRNRVGTLVSPTFNMRGQVVYFGHAQKIPEIASPDNALEKIQRRAEEMMSLATQEFPSLIDEIQRLSTQIWDHEQAINDLRSDRKKEQGELDRLQQSKAEAEQELLLAQTNVNQLYSRWREKELPGVLEEVRQEFSEKEAALGEKEEALEFALQQHYAAVDAAVDAGVAAEKKLLERDYRKRVEELSDREARLAPREARLERWKLRLDEREASIKEREDKLSLLSNLLASFSPTAGASRE